MATRQDLLINNPLAMTAPRAHARHLFNPTIDFLCLGGGSLIALALAAWLLPIDWQPELALLMLLVANVINHPHFAHSYQIFYKDFGSKITGRGGYGQNLKSRYILAGIVVPIALTAFLAATILAGAPRTLGIAGNIMTFFVGWHYVKQGYGMLILDSVLKKRFFETREKTVFLANSYATWLSYWVAVNAYLSARGLWGIDYYTIPIPDELVYLSSSIAGLTSLAMIFTIARRFINHRDGVAWNGVVAYIASVYAWLFLAFAPLLMFLIPAFHSLQYLAVVWRYRWNLDGAAPDAKARVSNNVLGQFLPAARVIRFVGFIIIGLIMGYAGFWGLPKALDALIPYDKAMFGPTLFLFVFWIFINVHHYFLDNVMWRRGNPAVMKHLFS